MRFAASGLENRRQYFKQISGDSLNVPFHRVFVAIGIRFVGRDDRPKRLPPQFKSLDALAAATPRSWLRRRISASGSLSACGITFSIRRTWIFWSG